MHARENEGNQRKIKGERKHSITLFWIIHSWLLFDHTITLLDKLGHFSIHLEERRGEQLQQEEESTRKTQASKKRKAREHKNNIGGTTTTRGHCK